MSGAVHTGHVKIRQKIMNLFYIFFEHLKVNIAMFYEWPLTFQEKISIQFSLLVWQASFFILSLAHDTIQFAITIVVFINYFWCSLLYLSFGNLSFSSHLHEIVVSIPLSSQPIIQDTQEPTSCVPCIFFFTQKKLINFVYFVCFVNWNYCVLLF